MDSSEGAGDSPGYVNHAESREEQINTPLNPTGLAAPLLFPEMGYSTENRATTRLIIAWMSE